MYNAWALMKLLKPQWLVPFAMVASIADCYWLSDFKF